MKRLKELTETFEVSRPIFKLTMERDGDTVSANVGNPIYKFRPTPIEGDCLSELVCSHYNESFFPGHGEFRIDKIHIASRALSEIRQSMSKFLENNLDMRNPRQSKIYRWFYRDLPDDNDFNDALCLLYKYMRSFCSSEMRSGDTEHTKNAIAVMEAIMEKYNDRR